MKKTTILSLILLLFVSSCSYEAGPDSEKIHSKRTDMIQDTAFKDPVSQNKTESEESKIRSDQTNPKIASNLSPDTDDIDLYSYRLPDRLPRINIVSQNPKDFSFVTTPDRENKMDYTKCKLSIQDCEEEYRLTDSSCQVKVRGNYTANYEKKPLRIKFDKKQTMLGLNDNLKAKSWVLLADYKDGSMTRNALAFYLGKNILGKDSYYCSDYQPVKVNRYKSIVCVNKI